MVADLKPNRSSRPSVLAVGERYDSMVHEFQKQAQEFNAAYNRTITSGTFSLDKLVLSYGSEYTKEC